jgi:tRNA-splicing ligase RtcB
MGRKQATKTLSTDEFKAQMVGKTWLDRDAKKLLDEAPSAYKPIDQVIEDSKDLIEPVTKLSQFINYKGL